MAALKHRITCKIESITYRTFHSSQPVCLRDLLINNQPTRTLRSSNSPLPIVPTVSRLSLHLVHLASRRLLFGTFYILMLKQLTQLMFSSVICLIPLFKLTAHVAVRRLCLTACSELWRLKSNILYGIGIAFFILLLSCIQAEIFVMFFFTSGYRQPSLTFL